MLHQKNLNPRPPPQENQNLRRGVVFKNTVLKKGVGGRRPPKTESREECLWKRRTRGALKGGRRNWYSGGGTELAKKTGDTLDWGRSR